MKRIRYHFGFTIIELILAIVISSLLVLTMGIVMVDSQRGWLDSYAKVHGGAAADAKMAKTAFDKVVRKASRSIYYFNGLDDITVYYYDNWTTSPELDRYAHLYRSQDNPSEMYVQHGVYENEAEQSVLTDVMLASNVWIWSLCRSAAVSK